MTTFGTGYSDWDAAEKAWAEAKAKRETTTGAPLRTPHGDPLAGALDKLSPLAEDKFEAPIATALADAREVISDTLFELRFVIGALEADQVMVNVPQVRATLRELYKELNGWANQHDLSPVDFVGRNDEELS